MKIIGIESGPAPLALRRQRISLADPTVRGEQGSAIVVRVQTDAGLEGIGFTYALGPEYYGIHSVIDGAFTPMLTGEDPCQTERHFNRAESAFRPVGFAGLAARAYAAVDIALWDLKAKAAEQPLHLLLGGARASAPFFLSEPGLLGTPTEEGIAVAEPLLKQGALGILVEVGSGDIEKDGRRIERFREELGEDGWLGVTAGGRFDLATALAMAHFLEEDVGIDWFEDPLPVSDRRGYVRLAERMEVPLALGSTFSTIDEFRQLLEIGDVRLLRPDVLRLGGITPFLKVAALAEAFPVTLSPFRLPDVGVHLACGLAKVQAVDHVGWLQSLFTKQLRIESGRIVPPPGPGLGLEFARS